MRGPAIANVEIETQALRDNLAAVVRAAGRPAYCVIKADAYGHGAVQVAGILSGEPGCAGFVVSRIEEALQLRGASNRSLPSSQPLLCLGVFLASHPETVRLDLLRLLNERAISVVLTSLDDVQALATAPALVSQALLPVHVAVDTGMRREGLEAESIGDALYLLRQAQVPVASVFSHLVEAEVEGSELSAQQRASFAALCSSLATNADSGPMVHLANSAAAVLPGPALPAGAPDGIVRVGGALYGVVDVPPNKISVRVRQAMSVRSSLVQVRQVAAGCSVGYNQSYTADADSLIGLVALGYADGLSANPPPLGWAPESGTSKGAAASELSEQSQQSERGEVLSMQRVPVVGKVSMDLVTVDLTAAVKSSGVEPRVGDEIVALGGARHRPGIPILASEHADRVGCSPYAVTVGFGRRLDKHFV